MVHQNVKIGLRKTNPLINILYKIPPVFLPRNYFIETLYDEDTENVPISVTIHIGFRDSSGRQIFFFVISQNWVLKHLCKLVSVRERYYETI